MNTIVDQDVVCLATRSSSSPQTPIPPAQRPVTGIVLHVEKCNSIEPFTLSFRKTTSSVVHIGRRSGNDSERRLQETEYNSAFLRCAVVSRRHAKIAFTDSGHAFLIDLGSHHGTHVRKAGERSSRALKPEVPAMLSDGDVVTFGKSVGSNEDCVRPVVARVELMFAGQNTSSLQNPLAIKPLVVPSPSTPAPAAVATSSAPLESTSADNRPTTPVVPPPAPATTPSSSGVKPTSSGRYGIDSSSSSDESSVSGDLYSDDCEKLGRAQTPPTSPPAAATSPSEPAVPDVSPSAPPKLETCGVAPLGTALTALRRLILPPMSPLPLASDPPPPAAVVNVAAPTPFRPRSWFLSPLSTFNPGPTLTNCYGSYQDGEASSSSSQHQVVQPASSLDLAASPEFCAMSPPTSPLGFADDDSDSLGRALQFLKEKAKEREMERERSNSPMDLASPSPPPCVVVLRPLSAVPPPSTSFMPTLGELPAPAVPPAPRDEEEKVEQEKPKQDSVAIDVDEADSPSPSVVELDDDEVAVMEMKKLKQSVQQLETDVKQLQSSRRKYRTRFTNNIQAITQRLKEFDDKLAEVNAEYTILYDQVDTIHHVEVPDLQANYEALQDRLDELGSPLSTPVLKEKELDEDEDEEMVPFAEREDVRRVMDEMGDIRDHIYSLRDEFRTEISTQLEAARAQVTEMFDIQRNKLDELKAELEALHREQRLEIEADRERLRAEIRAAVAKPVAVLPSLKRKRNDTYENGGGGDDDEAAVEGAEGGEFDQSKSADTEMTDALEDVVDDGAAPPRKKRRVGRVVSAVAQTATALTLGAAVMWSALAFY